MERFRKILVVSTMFVTVLSMSVVTVPNAGATASAGDLIKMSGLSSVYYLAADGKRYVFPNEQTYFSWYSDFSSVVTIPQTELEGYPLGKNVTTRPGTKLVKITTDPKVYAVEPNGNLVWVKTESAASTLYGADWAKRVVDVPDSFFTNYTVSSKELDGTAYPAGSLIKSASAADVYYIDSDGKAQKITTEAAFTANRFAWGNVLTSTLAIPTAGADIAGAVATLTDTSSGAGGAAGAGTGLTVALSSSTAGSSTLVDNQALANLATFNFTASNDGAVKVTTFKVKRIGVAADTTLPAIYLYDGATRLTDEATLSSTIATWNNSAGILTVDKGATKSITVYSNIANSTGGQTVGVQITAASDVTTDGASVSGTFPVSGNIHSIADGTLATVSFGAVTPSSDATINPQDVYPIWTSTVTVGTRTVNLKTITFRQIGSVATADLKNFKLMIAGVQIGDTVAAMDANGYVTFDLSSAPKSLIAQGHEFKILVDIVGGSSKTTSLSLRKTVDATFIDSELNQPILIQAASATFSARSSATLTIGTGSLTIAKRATSASGNITKGGSSVTLASYDFTASGEDIKVETLRANVDVSDGSIDKLRNGKIMANGVQIGSTADLYVTDGTNGYYTEYSLGSSLIVKPGSPVKVDIVADIYDNDGTDDISAGDTLQAQIASSTSNAQRQTALTFISAPGSDTAGNTLTVQTGSLTCSKYTGYSNQTFVTPATAKKLGEFRCTAGSTEDVNITQFRVDFDNSAGFTGVASDFNDVYIVYGDTTGANKQTVASTSNDWAVSKTLAKNGSLAVSVYGTVKSSATSGTINADLQIWGTTIGSQTTICASGCTNTAAEADGQTLTIGSGSLATAETEDPLDQIAFGNQTVTAANYKITALNDSYTVEEVAIKFTDTNVTDAVNAVYIYDGSTLLGSQDSFISGIATTSGLSLSVPANSTKTITVKLGLNNVGTGNATPGRNASTTLDTIVAQPGSGGSKTYVCDDRQGNQLIIYKVYPIVTYSSLSSTSIVNDALQDVYKFTVTPTNGTIGLKQFSLALSWSNNANTPNLTGQVTPGIELYNWQLWAGETNMTDLVSITTDDGLSVKADTAGLGASSTPSSAIHVAFLTSGEAEINAATAYTLKAKPGNFDSSTTGSDTVVIQLSGDTAASAGTTNPYVGDADGDLKWGLGPSATGTNTEYNFIWSDKSATNHTSAASGSSSADWANGYIVKNLPLSTTVLKK